jgi:hypothetical protein
MLWVDVADNKISGCPGTDLTGHMARESKLTVIPSDLNLKPSQIEFAKFCKSKKNILSCHEHRGRFALRGRRNLWRDPPRERK